MKTKFLLIGTCIITFSFFISCNSDEKTNDGSTAKITNEEIITNSKIDASVEDVTNIAEDQFSAQLNMNAKGGPIKSFLPSCATITTVLTNNTWTKTVDFGVEGCTLNNGNSVKGKMVVSFSNDFSSST